MSTSFAMWSVLSTPECVMLQRKHCQDNQEKRTTLRKQENAILAHYFTPTQPCLCMPASTHVHAARTLLGSRCNPCYSYNTHRLEASADRHTDVAAAAVAARPPELSCVCTLVLAAAALLQPTSSLLSPSRGLRYAAEATLL